MKEARLASLGNLHLPEDVVCLPKLALEAVHHVEQSVLPDMHSLGAVFAFAVHIRELV